MTVQADAMSRVRFSAGSALISAREILLDAASGNLARSVLNPERQSGARGMDEGLGAAIGESLARLKFVASDEAGRQLDYAALHSSEVFRAHREALTPRLRSFDPARLTTREARMAFWVDLYNALVLDAVDAFGVRGGVYEGKMGILGFFRRAAYCVGGVRLSLEDIEHGILRGNRGIPGLPGPHFGREDPRRAWVIEPMDPRIHFALNCASRSCPPIAAYSAARIDAELETAAGAFINGGGVVVDRERGEIVLSQIFRWYAVDFGASPFALAGRAALRSFVARYLTDSDECAFVLSSQAAPGIRFMPYDWRLNGTPR